MQTELTVPEQNTETRHADLRMGLMRLPVPEMQSTLDEYGRRREAFRKWLFDNLKEGVHFGYPPGCKPVLNEDGDMLVTSWQDGKKKVTVVTKDQWQAKPSLYEAGADLLIDLLMLRAEFDPDSELWRQAGGLPGRYFYRCRLFDQAGKLIGEGYGASQSEDKNTRNGQPLNLAVKIAKKRSKVDAIKNTYGLSDLFTQDLEEDDDSRTPKPPAADPNQPTVPPRAARVSAEDLKAVISYFKQVYPDRNQADFADFAKRFGGPKENQLNCNSWNRNQIGAVKQELDASLKDKSQE